MYFTDLIIGLTASFTWFGVSNALSESGAPDGVAAFVGLVVSFLAGLGVASLFGRI